MIEHFFTCSFHLDTMQEPSTCIYANTEFSSAEGSRADKPHWELS